MIESLLATPNILGFVYVGIITVIAIILIKFGFTKKEDVEKLIETSKKETDKNMTDMYEKLDKKIEILKENNECIFQKKELCISKHYHVDKLLELIINNQNIQGNKIDNQNDKIDKLHNKFDELIEKVLNK